MIGGRIFDKTGMAIYQRLLPVFSIIATNSPAMSLKATIYSLTGRFLNTEFTYGGYIGEQTIAEGNNEAIDLVKNLRSKELAMFHLEKTEQGPSGKNLNPSIPGR